MLWQLFLGLAAAVVSPIVLYTSVQFSQRPSGSYISHMEGAPAHYPHNLARHPQKSYRHASSAYSRSSTCNPHTADVRCKEETSLSGPAKSSLSRLLPSAPLSVISFSSASVSSLIFTSFTSVRGMSAILSGTPAQVTRGRVVDFLLVPLSGQSVLCAQTALHK